MHLCSQGPRQCLSCLHVCDSKSVAIFGSGVARTFYPLFPSHYHETWGNSQETVEEKRTRQSWDLSTVFSFFVWMICVTVYQGGAV